jgi:hypothetical protein
MVMPPEVVFEASTLHAALILGAFSRGVPDSPARIRLLDAYR